MINILALILSTLMVGEAGWTVQITNEAQPETEPTYIEEYTEEATYYEEPRQEATQADTIAEEPTDSDSGDEWEYLGSVRVTGYTWTGNTCANGRYPTSGYTVACNDLPIGTVVYIEGFGYRTVEDRGGMTRGTYWMDIYFDSVGECYNATGYYDAWIVEP